MGRGFESLLDHQQRMALELGSRAFFYHYICTLTAAFLVADKITDRFLRNRKPSVESVMLLTDGFCVLCGFCAENVFQAFLITSNLAFITLVNHEVVEQLISMNFER